jgi:hypothetical protein
MSRRDCRICFLISGVHLHTRGQTMREAEHSSVPSSSQHHCWRRACHLVALLGALWELAPGPTLEQPRQNTPGADGLACEVDDRVCALDGVSGLRQAVKLKPGVLQLGARLVDVARDDAHAVALRRELGGQAAAHQARGAWRGVAWQQEGAAAAAAAARCLSAVR